jgi:hypothetical protein
MNQLSKFQVKVSDLIDVSGHQEVVLCHQFNANVIQILITRIVFKRTVLQTKVNPGVINLLNKVLCPVEVGNSIEHGWATTWGPRIVRCPYAVVIPDSSNFIKFLLLDKGGNMSKSI